MERRCAYCGKVMGYKKGKGVTAGVCPACQKRVESDFSRQCKSQNEKESSKGTGDAA